MVKVFKIWSTLFKDWPNSVNIHFLEFFNGSLNNIWQPINKTFGKRENRNLIFNGKNHNFITLLGFFRCEN